MKEVSELVGFLSEVEELQVCSCYRHTQMNLVVLGLISVCVYSTGHRLLLAGDLKQACRMLMVFYLDS